MKSEIITTDDGSHSLYVSEIDESYHSTHGAVNESRHIFIGLGFDSRQDSHLSVLEIGFGAGLNAFLTLLDAERRGIAVDYRSIERYPVAADVAERFNYAEVLDAAANQKAFEAMHRAPWDQPVAITPNFQLTKIADDFTRMEAYPRFDCCYFDAFSPEKQPEMWDKSRFALLFEAANDNAVLTTYCAKGVVRRTLQEVGFSVERLAGPVGKREVLRATKNTVRNYELLMPE